MPDYIKNHSVVLLTILLSCTVIITSCSGKKTIPEDKFVKLYCDLVIAQDTTSGDFRPVRKRIFEKYSVSDAIYEQTLEYYNEDSKRWDDFFKKAEDYLQKIRKEKSP